MLILTLRTDKPDAEIGLFEDVTKLDYLAWHADRQLAETIHLKLLEVLKTHNCSFKDVQAVAVFEGPGSFTGLRIGISVANALAGGLSIPIVSASGDQWQKKAIARLRKGEDQKIVIPKYGSAPHITQAKK